MIVPVERIRTDVLVIGGGVTGCAAAYYLAGAGARVTLVEDPHIDVTTNDAALTPAQKAFRDRWLGSKTT